MQVFQFEDYRSYLISLCDEAPPRCRRIDLASAASCQASYLSQALKGRAHLTEDHLAGIAAFLRLSQEEGEYLLLLLRGERAGTDSLRKLIEGAKEKILRSQKSLKNRVKNPGPAASEKDLGIYVSTWVHSAVHLLTSDPGYQNPREIAMRLQLPMPKVMESLHFLESAGFVVKAGKDWRYKTGSLHFPKESPWQPALQASRRDLAARSIALNPKDAVHFSSVFTIDAADLKILEMLAAEFVEQSHQTIRGSGTKKLAALCLDLFEVV